MICKSHNFFSYTSVNSYVYYPCTLSLEQMKSVKACKKFQDFDQHVYETHAEQLITHTPKFRRGFRV